MSENKPQIFLDRVLDRITDGEFDEHLQVPFASRKMLRVLVTKKMELKVESGSTPVISDNEIYEMIADVRETAVFTTAVFLEAGILQQNDKGVTPRYQVAPEWDKHFNPPKATAKPE